MSLPTIVWQRLHEDVRIPTRSTERAGARDLRAHLTGSPVRVSERETREVTPVRDPADRDGTPHVELAPGARAIVPTGLRAQLPPGHVALVLPRSGLSFATALEIANAPGLVDEDYPGEWGVVVRNGGTEPLRVWHGERIAQVLFVRAEQLEDAEGVVGRTTDRTGGFGSTGGG